LSKRVAILGAGIMGASLALMLARRGLDVFLFDREDSPVGRASRWNEGKIHLGYLYAAAPTTSTAQAMIPGGLAFGRIVSDLIGGDVCGHATREDDIFLVHRHSVVGVEAIRARFDAVDALIRGHAEAGAYLADVSAARSRQLSRAELDEVSGSDDIVAGFEVPERSVDTQWVADRFGDALRAQEGLHLILGTTVRRVTRAECAGAGRWRVIGDPDLDVLFDFVVNALWEGRLEIDATAGLEPEHEWLHRYRLALFARTHAEVKARSALVCVGPFGDLKNYNGRDFYVSWYPTGLVAQGNGVTLESPVPLTAQQERRFVADVIAGLGPLLPATRRVLEAAESIDVRGGFVFASGSGSLADPGASLHRRDRFGVRRMGSYFSVDTGKYSTAPWLAARLAQEISNY